MMRNKVIEFNHISNSLNQDEINMLKKLYKSYHKSQICYRRKYKRLRRLKITLEMSSIFLTSLGAIIGSITLNPIILGALTAPGIMIQAYLTKSDLNNRVDRCKFAFTSYEKVLIQIKTYLRGVKYNESDFFTDRKVLDDIISDQCPSITKLHSKYDKLYF